MRVDAVGIAISLCSYSRSADYAAAAECAAELAAEIADAPARPRGLRSRAHRQRPGGSAPRISEGSNSRGPG